MSNLQLAILTAWGCLGFACSWLAGEKGRSQLNWFVLGLVFGVFALLVLGLAPVAREMYGEVSHSERSRTPESSVWRDTTGAAPPAQRSQRPPKAERSVVCPSCRSSVSLKPVCAVCGEPIDRALLAAAANPPHGDHRG
jgi:hypothetical protein